jgi:molybdopterin molybdotransferase
MLCALVQRDGGFVCESNLVPDDPRRIHEALLADADVVLVAGGSSVGQEDYAPSLLARFGELAIHGIAMRPSSPTGMGMLEGRLVFLLPGNPASCLCAYDFFAGRAVRVLGGRSKQWPYASSSCRLRREISSIAGRVDYVRVCCSSTTAHEWRGELDVEPIGGAGGAALRSVTQADGFVVVPEACELLAADSMVTVHWYDPPWHGDNFR